MLMIGVGGGSELGTFLLSAFRIDPERTADPSFWSPITIAPCEKRQKPLLKESFLTNPIPPCWRDGSALFSSEITEEPSEPQPNQNLPEKQQVAVPPCLKQVLAPALIM